MGTEFPVQVPRSQPEMAFGVSAGGDLVGGGDDTGGKETTSTRLGKATAMGSANCMGVGLQSMAPSPQIHRAAPHCRTWLSSCLLYAWGRGGGLVCDRGVGTVLLTPECQSWQGDAEQHAWGEGSPRSPQELSDPQR